MESEILFVFTGLGLIASILAAYYAYTSLKKADELSDKSWKRTDHLTLLGEIEKATPFIYQEFTSRATGQFSNLGVRELRIRADNLQLYEIARTLSKLERLYNSFTATSNKKQRQSYNLEATDLTLQLKSFAMTEVYKIHGINKPSPLPELREIALQFQSLADSDANKQPQTKKSKNSSRTLQK